MNKIYANVQSLILRLITQQPKHIFICHTIFDPPVAQKSGRDQTRRGNVPPTTHRSFK